MEYFSPAVQLGLTATPKRRDNVDTYAYFGEPVYVYSLKDGINDGNLTPFRVKQISTTLDDYVYTPDDTLIEDEIETGKRYEEADFNKIIGRGTRLYDGKDYFTIHDFVKAHHHFNDPEWDGEPIEPDAGQVKPVYPEEEEKEKKDEEVREREGRRRIKVRLADGKERNIQHMMVTSFWHPDGTPMSPTPCRRSPEQSAPCKPRSSSRNNSLPSSNSSLASCYPIT